MSQRNNSPVIKSSETRKHPPRTAIKKFSSRPQATNQLANHSNSNNSITTSTSDQDRDRICDICAQNVPGPEREAIFAFGKCDHYVCYVCSARLRVICDQSDCPICREKLDNVIFSSTRKRSYEKYNLKELLFNEKYRIYFENKTLLDAFEKLLKYECQECLKLVSTSTKDKINQGSSRRRGGANNRVTTIPNEEPQSKSISSQESSLSSSKRGDKRQTKSACSSPIFQDSTSGSGGSDQKEKAITTRGSNELVEKIKDEGQGLLEPAQVISKTFPDVFGLKNHLRIVHRLELCELCLSHNKLFPFEYSYYTRDALVKHRQDGEPRTSHRGHPSCKLCKNTFFNTDELLQHMSREHYHCHLCGRHDSPMLIYFLDYNSLRNHFQEKHYLCERDQCRHEQFTSAFDNLIDYQLHLVQAHGNSSAGLSRGEARQQRTITLDSGLHRAARDSLTTRHQDLPPNAAVVSTGTMATANSSRQLPSSINQLQLRQQRLPTRAEFPALGNQPQSFASSRMMPQFAAPPLSVNNFPSLTPTSTTTKPTTSTTATSNGTSTLSSSSSMSQRLAAGPSNSRGSFVRTAGGGLHSAEQLNEMDFPPLPEQPKAKGKKNKKQQTSSGAKGNETSGLSLDQLISTSLTLSNRNNMNGKKCNPKGTTSGSLAKKVKQKPLKIQLS